MLIETLLDTRVHVHYRFLTLGPEGAGADPDDATRGQRNGLCGAAVPGQLHLITGLHTGHVGVRIELHADEPPLGDEWEEAVEATFATTATDLVLAGFQDGHGPIDLPPGTYRVRYCARGMQGAHDLDTLVGDAEPVDHYLLQFWPGTGGERIVRQTTEAAAYWHREGTEPALTAEELTERVRTLRTERAAQPGPGWWAADAADEVPDDLPAADRPRRGHLRVIRTAADADAEMGVGPAAGPEDLTAILAVVTDAARDDPAVVRRLRQVLRDPPDQP